MNSDISDRIQLVNDKPINDDGEFILYWMIAKLNDPPLNGSGDAQKADP